MLTMDISHVFAQTHARAIQSMDIQEIVEIFSDMEARGRAMLEEEQIPAEDMVFIRSLDMCYEGQGHYVEVFVPSDRLDAGQRDQIIADFHDLHFTKFGHRMEAPAKTINVRVKAVGKIKQIPLEENPPASINIPPDAFKMGRTVFFNGQESEWVVLDRALLLPGNRLEGPLIVEERQHNAVVLPGQALFVDTFSNLIISNPGEVTR